VAAGNEAYSEDLELGATYLIVGCLSKAAPGAGEPFVRFELWVNPAHEDSSTPDAVSVGEAMGRFYNFGIRVPTLSADDSALIASFRMGTSWHDVVPPISTPKEEFLRGDVNADADVNLTDAVFTLNHLFLGGPEPGCMDAADADDDGSLQITDPVLTLNWLFLSGRTPPSPGAEICGEDPTEDLLSCEDFPPCE
jgi:hypothetical protein